MKVPSIMLFVIIMTCVIGVFAIKNYRQYFGVHGGSSDDEVFSVIIFSVIGILTLASAIMYKNSPSIRSKLIRKLFWFIAGSVFSLGIIASILGFLMLVSGFPYTIFGAVLMIISILYMVLKKSIQPILG